MWLVLCRSLDYSVRGQLDENLNVADMGIMQRIPESL